MGGCHLPLRGRQDDVRFISVERGLLLLHKSEVLFFYNGSSRRRPLPRNVQYSRGRGWRPRQPENKRCYFPLKTAGARGVPRSECNELWGFTWPSPPTNNVSSFPLHIYSNLFLIYYLFFILYYLKSSAEAELFLLCHFPESLDVA